MNNTFSQSKNNEAIPRSDSRVSLLLSVVVLVGGGLMMAIIPHINGAEMLTGVALALTLMGGVQTFVLGTIFLIQKRGAD